MGKEFFKEKTFLEKADEIREQKGITRAAFCEYVLERDGTAYSPLMKGREHLSITALLRTCKLLGIRTEWALFGEGPVTNDEVKDLEKITTSIRELAAFAQRAVERSQDAKPVRRLMGVAEVASQLDWLVANSLVELPRPLWIALKYAHRTAHHEAALLGSERPSDLYPDTNEVPQDVLQAVAQSRQDQAVP